MIAAGPIEPTFRWRRVIPQRSGWASGRLSVLVAELGGWANCVGDLDTRKSRDAVRTQAERIPAGATGYQIGNGGRCFDVERVA